MKILSFLSLAVLLFITAVHSADDEKAKTCTGNPSKSDKVKLAVKQLKEAQSKLEESWKTQLTLERNVQKANEALKELDPNHKELIPDDIESTEETESSCQEESSSQDEEAIQNAVEKLQKAEEILKKLQGKPAKEQKATHKEDVSKLEKKVKEAHGKLKKLAPDHKALKPTSGQLQIFPSFIAFSVIIVAFFI